MTRFNTLLAALLVVQLLITIFVWTRDDDHSVYQADDNLITINLGSIDTITITDADKQALNLGKVGEQWQLPDYYDVAINTEKFDRVIEQLQAIKTGWPVATTEDAAPRFKVAKDKFETRIDFKQQDKIIETLYFGISPRYRKVHVRKAANNEIYNIEFGTYELSTKGKDWMTKDLLKLDATDLNQVKINDLVLVRMDGEWQLEGLTENQNTAKEAASNLINKLTNLSYTEITGNSDKLESGFETPDLSVELTNKSGEIIKLDFAKKDGEDYIAKSSALIHYFKVSQFSLEAILKINRDELVAERVDTDITDPAENLENTQ